jgi:hypothetical protein
MARFANVNTIMNRVAVEIGLNSVIDPVSSQDELFIQMRILLDGAGQELLELHPWQKLNKVYTILTKEGDTGTYDLPADFGYMIQQTGWDLTNNVSMGGPLSAQDWSYLAGRDLVSQSIYASFREVDGKMDLYPQPPSPGIDIRFEYISRNWLIDSTDTTITRDTIESGNDICVYDPILIVKYLKVKQMDAKGFDSSAARMEFETIFLSRTSKDEGSAILSASHGTRGFPYLTPYYNTGDTGFGI